MRANALNDAAVAFVQRVWLARLQALQPERPICAQTQKTDTWQPWDSYLPDQRFWTRSILLTEIVCDVDTPEKGTNRLICEKWSASAVSLGARPLGPVDSGGRGWHAHVWLDPDSLLIDGKLLDECEKLGVDVYKVVRETLWEAICAPLNPEERFSLDEGKVKWSTKKQGSMVRDFGSVGRLGYAKSLEPGLVVALPDESPALWDVSPFRALIEAALREKVAAYKLARKAEKTPKRALETARAGLLKHPCVALALSQGAPVGERGTTGLHILRLSRAEGLTSEQACAVIMEFVRACEANGSPMTDDLVARVSYVYDGEPPRIACPNPMRLSVCGGPDSTSCPKRRFCLAP